MRFILAAAALAASAVLLFPPAPATRVVWLQPGTMELAAPIEITGSRVEVRGSRTVLRPAPGFKGPALLVCRGCSHARFSGFTIDGNRATLEARQGLPPSNVTFARFTPHNGILLEGARGVRIEDVAFTEVAGFAILASGCGDVRIRRVTVRSSGSRNPLGRNNTTGGILIEDGTAGFEVSDSAFENLLGNGVWTHSRYTAPRNRDGLIARNRFFRIGRDAIQVGHATRIRVEDNQGREIGYPFDAVDVENGATPVAIDTSGNVDRSAYLRNRFEELNGKCIDLDGFHHGEVLRNQCVNRGAADSYPHGHFGIVVNNWNPDMRSEGITIAENIIDGAKFGGIFLLGSGHRVLRNRLLNLNLAACNESAAKYGCVAIQGEPDVLQAGIYLGRIAAEWAQKRASASSGHVIQGNEITGFMMERRCVMSAPGVRATDSDIRDNLCRNCARNTLK
ncbi:MAG TPA: right-handed parallel beta-helix repeat-containing protein [Bryobacteraceae bacterium]|nr:right-handed parallel beta-helix repeat-containing protein [Bryobacteraceae bacterium]